MRDRVASPEVMSSLLYSGSVKDVYGQAGKDPYIFVFSDRYSIFDWGEMPDALPGKGEALAMMGDLLFRFLGRTDCWSEWQIPDLYPVAWRERLASSSVFRNLKKYGLSHHSLGLVNESGEALSEGASSKRLAVRALERPPAIPRQEKGRLSWDYSAYASRPERALVPLEVVFRFGAPEGSSFLSRLEKIPGYAESFGFRGKPEAGELFPYPVVEFFTKLEPTDRFLSREEALSLASLLPEELEDLASLTTLLALRLRDLFSQLGLELWDGKFEFAFLPGKREAGDGQHRAFQLVDSIGPDELRLIGPGGVHFSKEFLRRIYRGTSWYEAMERAKNLARERGVKDWKKICREELAQKPESLSPVELEKARLMMPVLTNGLAQLFLGKSLFPGMPSVVELCSKLRDGS